MPLEKVVGESKEGIVKGNIKHKQRQVNLGPQKSFSDYKQKLFDIVLLAT